MLVLITDMVQFVVSRLDRSEASALMPSAPLPYRQREHRDRIGRL